MLYLWSMTIAPKQGNPFVFVVKLSRGRRVIALVFAGLFILMLAYIPLRVGLHRFLHGLNVNPAMWLLVVTFAIPIGFFSWLAFPPRAVLAKLEIQRNNVRFIPNLAVRRFLAEPIVKAVITPQSKEILVCQAFLGKLPDGYNVVIRTAGENDRVVRAASLTLHTAQEGQEIADGITAATGLPVRLITREQLTDGTVQEVPWVPSAPKTKLLHAGLAIAAVPWVGGVVLGYIFPRPAIIVTAGLTLWLCEMLAVFIIARRSHKRTQNLAVHMLATFFTFAASYAFAVGLVAFVFRAH